MCEEAPGFRPWPPYIMVSLQRLECRQLHTPAVHLEAAGVQPLQGICVSKALGGGMGSVVVTATGDGTFTASNTMCAGQGGNSKQPFDRR
jgi:hypothetical protein